MPGFPGTSQLLTYETTNYLTIEFSATVLQSA